MAARILNAVLKRWGPVSAKQRIWDHEYQSGQWAHLDFQARNDVRRDLIYLALEPYSAGATILDLGCGTASTAMELPNTYDSYLGVDVSEIAIRKATDAIGLDPSRVLKCHFIVGDIATFIPAKQFDIIVCRECLYYFSRHEARTILRRHSAFLQGKGVFVVRLHDRDKYRSITEMIKREYRIIQWFAPEGATEVVLVFRPTTLAHG